MTQEDLKDLNMTIHHLHSAFLTGEIEIEQNPLIHKVLRVVKELVSRFPHVERSEVSKISMDIYEIWHDNGEKPGGLIEAYKHLTKFEHPDYRSEDLGEGL